MKKKEMENKKEMKKKEKESRLQNLANTMDSVINMTLSEENPVVGEPSVEVPVADEPLESKKCYKCNSTWSSSELASMRKLLQLVLFFMFGCVFFDGP